MLLSSILLVFLIRISTICNFVCGAPFTRPTPPTNQAGPHSQCLTHISMEERAEFERGLIEARSFSSGLLAERATDTEADDDTDTGIGMERYTFNVSFNVIFTNETREGGWVPDNDIQAQIKVLNDDYNSTGISFVLVKTTRINSSDWFANVYPGSDQELAMKEMYNIGDASTLNVYTLTFNSTTKSLGAAAIPSAYYRDSKRDGVMIRHSTVTNGPRENYNMGRTLVHEVGHWLGLFHTFEGGCDDGVGDNIADTPPQASGSEGCPVGRDSCPGNGPDLIDNFMDYSFDSCMTSFTKGQIVRMRESAEAFRRPGGKTAPPPKPKTNSTSASASAASPVTSTSTQTVSSTSTVSSSAVPTS